MKAAIYCRLSKEDEYKIGESESIQNQKSMLIQYAIEKGFDIYQIYSDEDYSGIDRNRPAFNSMIQAASEHKFDVVLAKTQSRFTRDMELVEKYLHGKFIEWGIRFIGSGQQGYPASASISMPAPGLRSSHCPARPVGQS